jgi:HNH endonuclease
MARKRRRSDFRWNWYALLIALVLVLLVVITAVRYWPVTVGLLVAIAAALYYRRRRRITAHTTARREEEEHSEANRQDWRRLTFEPGMFSVLVTGLPGYRAKEKIAVFLTDLPELRARTFDEVKALVERVEHVKPQAIAGGISQRDAIHLKEAIEKRGGKARIKEGTPRRRSSAGRKPIREKVRSEVWRRDGGQCVDCGSRERLEYDHIVAVANGGSNTARNLELRCEPCNRKKAAEV